MTSANRAPVTFRHTALGELHQSLDDKGTTTWTYDRLGRTVKRADADGVSEWQWDAPNAKGALHRRCREDSAAATRCLFTAAPGPTAATTVTVGASTHTLSYDAGGRVTRDDEGGADGTDRHFEWNARGLLKRAVAGASLADPAPESAEEYAYGPDGERYYRMSAWRDDGGDGGPTHPVEHWFYVGSFEERIGGGAGAPRVETVRIAGAVLHTRTTAAADGTAGAVSVRESIRYLHRDHLGSVRAVTDADGTVVARAAYDPFGGRRLPDGTQEAGEAEREAAAGDAALDPARGFTGHEQLDRLGLVHMGGRVHDPRLGRFLSPDPVVGNPGSSQSWHAYSYVGNSPMSFTDPTGLIRAPMPWERDPCSRVSGCLNLTGGGGGGGGGGFGSGTALVEGVRGHLNIWVSWVLFQTGHDRDVIGYQWIPRLNISFALERTFTNVAVPAKKRPGDRPTDSGGPPGVSTHEGPAAPDSRQWPTFANWATQAERNSEMMAALKPYVDEGDYIGFWETALHYGDPLAQLSLDLHGSLYGETFATRVAISKLELAYTGGNVRLSRTDLAALKQRVGKGLIDAHYGALEQDIREQVGMPGVLSVRQTDEYHYEYFKSIGLPKNAYGGLGVPGWMYCPRCDPVSP